MVPAGGDWGGKKGERMDEEWGKRDEARREGFPGGTGGLPPGGLYVPTGGGTPLAGTFLLLRLGAGYAHGTAAQWADAAQLKLR